MREYNGGLWTESRFTSFIKSALRAASLKWPPRWQVLKEAFVGIKENQKTKRQSRHYKCNSCKQDFPTSEVEVNHKLSVVPYEGITSWDVIIERMFCEADGLEVLCKPCHKIVTAKEKEARKAFTAVKQKGKKA